MSQKGFFIDVSRCAGCRTCSVACADLKNMPVGLNLRRVIEYEGGSWRKNWDGTWRQVYSSDSIHTQEKVEELRRALLSGEELSNGYYSVYLRRLDASQCRALKSSIALMDPSRATGTTLCWRRRRTKACDQVHKFLAGGKLGAASKGYRRAG